MLPESPSTKAWIGLGIGIAAYDILAPEGETLSDGFRRGLEHPIYKYLCIGGLGATALHLMKILPEPIDPFTQFLKAVK
jgi:hypothetical protein